LFKAIAKIKPPEADNVLCMAGLGYSKTNSARAVFNMAILVVPLETKG
jgi:hypothetical protein